MLEIKSLGVIINTFPLLDTHLAVQSYCEENFMDSESNILVFFLTIFEESIQNN